MTKTREGYTPLYIAIENGQDNVVKVINEFFKSKSGFENRALLSEAQAGIHITYNIIHSDRQYKTFF